MVTEKLFLSCESIDLSRPTVLYHTDHHTAVPLFFICRHHGGPPPATAPPGLLPLIVSVFAVEGHEAGGETSDAECGTAPL